MSQVNLFTIPAGLAFADELARGITQRFASGAHPFALSAAMVLVPTRRAIRTLREAFERTAGGGMVVLPSIVALGDFDEDDLRPLSEFSGDMDIEALVRPDGLAAPIAPLRRDMLLFSLVRAWEAKRVEGQPALGTDQPAIALQLARELARILDLAASEGVAWERLRDLVPGSLSTHWEQTIAFLDIVATIWPDILRDEQKSDPAVHRDASLRRAARLWLETPPRYPVIAAGSTGSVPATAELLHTIARLPQGAVVLPGLDLNLDAASWDALSPNHPQHGMAQLLRKFEVRRADVEIWTDTSPRADRVRLIAEAMRPAATTVGWRSYVEQSRDSLQRALGGLSCLVARSPAEEALAIACALREAVETPGRTAALVTPDRNLARRVASELRRWDIAIDDSAGTPLSHTEPGRLLCLLADVVALGFSPVPLLALLKHPQCLLGYESRVVVRRLTASLETGHLRGQRPSDGLEGLIAKVGDSKPARGLVLQLERALGSFAAIATQMEAPLEDFLGQHRIAGELVSSAAGGDGAAVWRGEAGKAAFMLFDEALAACAALGLKMGPKDYAAFVRTLMDQVAVRPAGGLHPRLSILGPLEARLLQSDLVILGGLNEGKWPPVTDPGPWLNRPMRRDLAISQPERRIGLSAHDFAQAAAAPMVILSRAAKEGGAPTTPSRWLTRISTLVEGAGLLAQFRDDRLVDIAREISRPAGAPKPVDAPAPIPPVSARPRRLPVTDVETWLRDPYSLYAKAILRLKPLRPLDEEPGAAARGSAIHKALEAFSKRYPGALPPQTQAVEEILALARDSFGPLLDRPVVRAIWWPRFERSVHWYLEWERQRRSGLLHVVAEQKGAIAFEAPAGSFTLTATADRIEVLPEGAIRVCDYKTGRTPTEAEVQRGFSPQLTLEAAIALAGGYAGIAASRVDGLVYVGLSGAGEGGKDSEITFDGMTLDEGIRHACDRFKAFVATFDAPDMPYLSKPHVLLMKHEGDYDHLARVKEWSSGGNEE